MDYIDSSTDEGNVPRALEADSTRRERAVMPSYGIERAGDSLTLKGNTDWSAFAAPALKKRDGDAERAAESTLRLPSYGIDRAGASLTLEGNTDWSAFAAPAPTPSNAAAAEITASCVFNILYTPVGL